MVNWVNDTGAKRSCHDTEAEMRPVKPQKASIHSTGYTSKVGQLATDGIIEKAMKDRLAMEEAGFMATAGEVSKDADGDAGEERQVDEDRPPADEDSLEALRARRRKQMKDAQERKQKYQQNGHGEYSHILEEDFLKTVTSSYRAVVHFYHREFERCKIIDMHINKCAKKFFGTKFVYMDAEKAPFFVEKLGIRTLPCVVVFVDGVAKGRQVGFDGLGGDDFTTAQLAWVFKEAGGIEEEFGPEDDIE